MSEERKEPMSDELFDKICEANEINVQYGRELLAEIDFLREELMKVKSVQAETPFQKTVLLMHNLERARKELAEWDKISPERF